LFLEFKSARDSERRHAGDVFLLQFAPRQETTMDKDRIEGAANQAKGAAKEAVGKIAGDAKLKAEGVADKTKGKVQSAVGGVKDAVRDLRDR
jgi:uncharacterized protein YjbJ (UPF0337 family)